MSFRGQLRAGDRGARIVPRSCKAFIFFILALSLCLFWADTASGSEETGDIDRVSSEGSIQAKDAAAHFINIITSIKNPGDPVRHFARAELPNRDSEGTKILLMVAPFSQKTEAGFVKGSESAELSAVLDQLDSTEVASQEDESSAPEIDAQAVPTATSNQSESEGWFTRLVDTRLRMPLEISDTGTAHYLRTGASVLVGPPMEVFGVNVFQRELKVYKMSLDAGIPYVPSLSGQQFIETGSQTDVMLRLGWRRTF